jgi:hypothetical protein
MKPISRLEQAESLDKVVAVGQWGAPLIRPAGIRDSLHGAWLGHRVHPLLVQAAAGTWLSATLVDLVVGDETAARRLTAAGLAASAPAIAAGAVDLAAGGVLGGHISFRLAGGANHAEAVPHLVEPGWHRLPMARKRLPHRRRIGGTRPGHRAATGIRHSRGRRRDPGTTTRCRLISAQPRPRSAVYVWGGHSRVGAQTCPPKQGER